MGEHEMIISNDDIGEWLVDKIENEGLDYAIQHYFGRELGSNHERLNSLWAEAYDILTEISAILEAADRPE